MKNLLFIVLMLVGSYAFSGDGTLPVIRSVQIDFVEAGQDLQELLPECMNIELNKSVQKSIRKTLTLSQADLEQVLYVQNIGGELSVNVKSRSISDRILIHMHRQDLNQNEFLHEFNHHDNTLIQHIQVNPETINSNCVEI